MTITDTETNRGRWASGVTPYAEMGYYDADYEPKDTDILCAFRITPQDGVDPIEAAAAVAGESSTATWTVVWTDRLTAHEHYQAKAYEVSAIPGRPGEYLAKIAYDIDLFEEGSIANLTSSIIGNVFGFKALKALRLEDMRIPAHYVKTFQGPAARHRQRARVARQVRAAAARRDRQAEARPVRQELRARRVRGAPRRARLHQGRREHQLAAVHALARPLPVRDRGRQPRPAATGEVKGHYMNVTAGDMEDMYERAEFAKEIGSGHHHDRPDRRLHGDAVDGQVGARNGLILHLHRAGHGTYTRQKTHGVSFRVIAKWCRLIGVDHIHAGTVVGKLEGDPPTTQGLLRHPAARPRPGEPRDGIYFDQDWASLPGVMPVASGGIHAGQMHQLLQLPRRGRDPPVRRRHDRTPDGDRAPARPPTVWPSRR